ncbi:hypothetical protein EVAR_7360_1 [Eumeta japonica]|uniref:Uncharacterized protein n=1 Tax=Eumeta variegata TaxID=151549 RepID=A0A4C1T2Z1_EUMVA|nr:hypothetical protein EVAR_7360_1 [Eumeta japonica]
MSEKEAIDAFIMSRTPDVRTLYADVRHTGDDAYRTIDAKASEPPLVPEIHDEVYRKLPYSVLATCSRNLEISRPESDGSGRRAPATPM